MPHGKEQKCYTDVLIASPYKHPNTHDPLNTPALDSS